MASTVRFDTIVKSIQPIILESIASSSSSSSSANNISSTLQTYIQAAINLSQTYNSSKSSYLNSPNPDDGTLPFLSTASSRLYKFLGKNPGVPFLHLILKVGGENGDGEGGGTRAQAETFVTEIYSAIRDRGLFDSVMEGFGEMGWGVKESWGMSIEVQVRSCEGG